MKRFVNILLIIIGLFFFICIIFISDMSEAKNFWLGLIGLIFIILGWIAINDERK